MFSNLSQSVAFGLYGTASVLSLVHVSVCAGHPRVSTPELVPKQQSQLQRQHSLDSSAAASAAAVAITAAAEGSMSSRDVSPQSSPAAASLIQPEQAFGDAQSVKSTGTAASAMLADEIGSSSASADVVVPQVQGRAVAQSSAAIDGDQICFLEDDRQSVAESQAHASAEEAASRVLGATADVSPQHHDTAIKGHATLAMSLAGNAESASANAANAEAPMALDAAMARWWQDKEDCKGAGLVSTLQSNESMAALEGEIVADIGQLHRRPKLHPITTYSQPSTVLSYGEKIYQLELEQAVAASLQQSECVGEKVPLESRAGDDKDSPYGRLPRIFSRVRSIKGEERHVA